MLRADQVGGRAQLLVVLGQIRDEAAQLTQPETAAVPAQVEGVEREAGRRERVGHVGLEEVVVPPVQVEHGVLGPLTPARRTSVATISISSDSPGARAASGNGISSDSNPSSMSGSQIT